MAYLHTLDVDDVNAILPNPLAVAEYEEWRINFASGVLPEAKELPKKV